jgi:hypothetical protein
MSVIFKKKNEYVVANRFCLVEENGFIHIMITTHITECFYTFIVNHDDKYIIEYLNEQIVECINSNKVVECDKLKNKLKEWYVHDE